jgi:hypothetical protein
MKIFGLNITKDKSAEVFWTHFGIVSTKRGRKILYLNGYEIKDKNFTLDFWTNDANIQNFAKSCIKEK